MLAHSQGTFCRVVGVCHGIAYKNLDEAGIYLDTGIGFVLVLRGRRTLDGKPGVSGRGEFSVSEHDRR